MILLAIESSCDETAAAVIQDGNILSNVVATQSVHENYGGIVPELAARAHQQNIIPTVNQAINDAHISKHQLQAIAFTQGPGLLGALLVGASFAKSLAYALKIPLIAVNHMKAHILANLLDTPKPTFPFLCLTVSGGHTQLVLVKDALNMQLLGQTQDDAVGEAFDKIARLMDIPWPGGAWVDRYAQKGNPHRFTFPTTHMPLLNFSFSGIKTAFLYFLKSQQEKEPAFVEIHRNDLCASIQAALVRILLEKLQQAVAKTGIRQVALAGGVAANTGLRHALQDLAKKSQWAVFMPKPAYCTDNAAMIAIAAHAQYLAGDFCNLSVQPMSRMPF